MFNRKSFVGAILVLLTLPVWAQEAENSFFTDNGDIATNIPTSIDLSERKPIEYNNPRTDDVMYQKVIYRVIDLREKVNYPLYFPLEEGDQRISLFALIFKLAEEGKVNCYTFDPYLRKEDFTANNKLTCKQIYDVCKIEGVPTNMTPEDSAQYRIPSEQIPNKSVLKYYIKEVWYFDKSNSTFHVRILGIAPKLYTEADDDEVVGNSEGSQEKQLEGSTLFWVPFEQLRPYIAQREVLLTDRNNGARESIDDFFIKRKFGSYIVKESNVMNRMLLEYNRTAEQARKEQDRIKKELFNFEQDLWEY